MDVGLLAQSWRGLGEDEAMDSLGEKGDACMARACFACLARGWHLATAHWSTVRVTERTTTQSSPRLCELQDSEATYLVLEACGGGTLIEAIANSGGRLAERVAARLIAMPLLRALVYLHARGVVHRCSRMALSLASCHDMWFAFVPARFYERLLPAWRGMSTQVLVMRRLACMHMNTVVLMPAALNCICFTCKTACPSTGVCPLACIVDPSVRDACSLHLTVHDLHPAPTLSFALPLPGI